MAVFPENMNKLNPDDARGSMPVSRREGHGYGTQSIRYMTERTEFAMRNMTKTVSAAGVSSAELFILLTALQNDLSALKSTVNGISGNVTSVSNQLSSLQDKVTATEGTLASLEQRVAALEQTETT